MLFRSSDLVQEVIFRWGGRVQPEPTPTPWPTWNPVAPTPTPIQGTPKVLWIVRERALPEYSRVFNFVDFFAIFAELGAENSHLIAGSQSVTESLLDGYEVVVFGDTDSAPPLSESEQECVVQFVRGGGSIFVIGNQSLTYMVERSGIYASSITGPFGIRFSTSINGEFDHFADHPITKDVVTVLNGGSMLLIESPAEAIGWTSEGEAILAVANDGYGRVVAYSDWTTFISNPFWGLSQYSNRQFAGNIAAWLLHKEDGEPVPVEQWEIY